MATSNSPASDAIALLIELAENKEINPWDVEVITMIDRFLAELGIDDLNNLNPQPTDLSQSGQVMLWASMLVLYKAETLQQIEEQKLAEDNNDLEEENESNESLKNRSQSDLHKQIKRRTSALPPSKRKVTLDEFITQLKIMEAELNKTQLSHKIPLKKKKKYTRKQALKTITELAHNENLTELAQQLNNFLKHKSTSLTNNYPTFKLDELVSQWQQHKLEEKQDKVGIFWALLLLSSQSKVELSQEEFYQDLSIMIINKNSELESKG